MSSGTNAHFTSKSKSKYQRGCSWVSLLTRWTTTTSPIFDIRLVGQISLKNHHHKSYLWYQTFWSNITQVKLSHTCPWVDFQIFLTVATTIFNIRRFCLQIPHKYNSHTQIGGGMSLDHSGAERTGSGSWRGQYWGLYFFLFSPSFSHHWGLECFIFTKF